MVLMCDVFGGHFYSSESRGVMPQRETDRAGTYDFDPVSAHDVVPVPVARKVGLDAVIGRYLKERFSIPPGD